MIAPVFVIGRATFAALVWGAVALVVGVFGYEIYAVLDERR